MYACRSERRRTPLATGVDGASAEVHEAIAPRSGEIVVTRPRVSTFSGGDLDVVLRARAIDLLVLTGIATSGAVLSTLRQAADLDYTLTVLADGCADPTTRSTAS
jgi:nicotinamidase-related amidase